MTIANFLADRPACANSSKLPGFSVLLATIIVGAIGVAAAVSLMLWSINTTQNALTFLRMYQAQDLADACAQVALQAIHDDYYFSGSGNLSLDNGVCDYAVTIVDSQGRQINAAGHMGDSVRRVKVIVSRLRPKLSISSWKEVADF